MKPTFGALASRPDRPLALRGPRSHTVGNHYTQHASVTCRALVKERKRLPDNPVLTGCVLCGNTQAVQDIADAARMLLRIHRETQGNAHDSYMATSTRLSSDPAWGGSAMSMQDYRDNALYTEDVEAWLLQAQGELMKVIFRQEPYQRLRSGPRTLLVPIRSLSYGHDEVILQRIPHLVLTHGQERFVLISVSSEQADNLIPDPSLGRRSSNNKKKPYLTRMPVSLLTSEKFADVWKLALEVLDNPDKEFPDLDEVLTVIQKTF